MMVSGAIARVRTIDGLWALPEGWEWVPLEVLCSDIVGGGTPKRARDEYYGGDIIWVTPSDLDANDPCQEMFSSRNKLTPLGLESSSAKLVPDRTILFSSRATIGKIAIAGVPLCTNQGFANLICSDLLDNHYLAWCLYALTDEIKKLAGSTTYLEVSRGNLRRFKIPLPFPSSTPRSLETQRRIAARIEALMAEVKKARTLLGHIRRDADMVLDATLAEIIQKLDRRSPESPTLHALISDGRLTITGGGTPSTGNKHYWNGAIPWVSPKDMKSWYIDDTQDHISPVALEETAVKLVPKKSVLVVVRGMILAHTFPVSVTTKEVTINQDMKALSPADDLLPEYLAYILRARASSILREVEIAAHGTRRLKTDTLMQVVVPDIPKDSQQRTVAYLDSVQSAVNDMQRILDQDAKLLDQLEQSILERAFRGEL